MNVHTPLGWVGHLCDDGKIRYGILEISEYEVLHELLPKALKTRRGITNLMGGKIRVRITETRPDSGHAKH